MIEKARWWIDLAERSFDYPVLVRCGGRIDRSPALVAYWLVKSKGHNVAEAFDMIRSKRSSARFETLPLPLTFEERTRRRPCPSPATTSPYTDKTASTGPEPQAPGSS